MRSKTDKNTQKSDCTKSKLLSNMVLELGLILAGMVMLAKSLYSIGDLSKQN